MRNILSHVPARDKKYLAGRIKQIWNQPDSHSAREYANRIIDEFEEQFPKSMNCLEEGLEDSVQFFEFSEIDSRKTSSANQLEGTSKKPHLVLDSNFSAAAALSKYSTKPSYAPLLPPCIDKNISSSIS